MRLNVIKGAALAAAAVVSVSAMAAAPRFGILAASDSESNPQEKAAIDYVVNTLGGQAVTNPADLSLDNFDAVMVHIDRIGIGAGYDNLPADFKDAAPALTEFAKAGGGVYLSKMATQMVGVMELTDFLPNIFGDGDGGSGTDDWAINPQLGSWQLNSACADPDLSQYYDRSGHPIYAGLEMVKLFPDAEQCGVKMEGTGTGEAMHREDHNCMWDLNALTFTAEGKNTIEKWETETNSVVLGTWGHVQDYCVVGINEFVADDSYKGTVIANGLATCEWAPRQNNNAFHGNLETLTANILNYIAAANSTNSVAVETAADGEPVYYNMQGVQTANPANGLYIKVVNGKAQKVVVR